MRTGCTKRAFPPAMIDGQELLCGGEGLTPSSPGPAHSRRLPSPGGFSACRPALGPEELSGCGSRQPRHGCGESSPERGAGTKASLVSASLSLEQSGSMFFKNLLHILHQEQSVPT